MTSKIITKEGHEVLVDEENYEDLSQHKWTIFQRTKRGKYYAARKIKARNSNGKNYTKILMMHRYILGAPYKIHVHHKNNNGLDNRKENLQLMNQEDHFKYHQKHRDNKLWMIGKKTPITNEVIFTLKCIIKRVKKEKIKPRPSYTPLERDDDSPYWLDNPKLELW